MYDLLALLKEIADKVKLEDEQYDSIIKRFYKIYKDGFRHSYAELSRFCENDIAPDQRDELVNRIKEIIKLIQEDDTYKCMTKNLGKLADHLDLERIRLARMEAINRIGAKAAEEMQAATSLFDENVEKYNELRKKIKKTKKNIHDINTQIVSVLGIFAAIIVAFFGGFSYFSSVFSNLHQLEISEAMFFTGLLGFVIFNTIVMLLVVVSHLIDKPVYFKKAGKPTAYLGIFILTNVVIIMVILLSALFYILGHKIC